MMVVTLLLAGTAHAGLLVENTSLNILISGGEPVNLRVHIRAEAGLSAPANADYRIQYQGGQNASKVYTQTEHTALKTASRGASACSTGGGFASRASSLLSSFWDTLNSAEQRDLCNIYKAVDGSPATGISVLYHYEIHVMSPPSFDYTKTFSQSTFSSLVSEAKDADEISDYEPNEVDTWPGFTSGTRWNNFSEDVQTALWQLLVQL